MSPSNDELRRELRATQAQHDDAMPVFADALDRAFDGDANVPAEDKARLLGLPGVSSLSDRRGFLKIGGLSLSVAAIAAACVYPDKEHTQVRQTGTMAPPAPTTTKPPNPGSKENDITFLLTAISIENLAVATYQAAIDSGYLTTPGYVDVAKYFMDQHKDHAGLLVATTKNQYSLDASSIGPNEYIKKNVVDPAVATIDGEKGNAKAAETDTLKLAAGLEDAAAQTYTLAGGILTTPELRQAILSIGAVEARHYSLLSSVVEQPPVPFAFEHTNGAAPKDSFITSVK